jgi:hypothetical protein
MSSKMYDRAMEDESPPPSDESAPRLGILDRAKKAKDHAATTSSKLKDVTVRFA